MAHALRSRSSSWVLSISSHSVATDRASFSSPSASAAKERTSEGTLPRPPVSARPALLSDISAVRASTASGEPSTPSDSVAEVCTESSLCASSGMVAAITTSAEAARDERAMASTDESITSRSLSAPSSACRKGTTSVPMRDGSGRRVGWLTS